MTIPLVMIGPGGDYTRSLRCQGQLASEALGHGRPDRDCRARSRAGRSCRSGEVDPAVYRALSPLTAWPIIRIASSAPLLPATPAPTPIGADPHVPEPAALSSPPPRPGWTCSNRQLADFAHTAAALRAGYGDPTP